MIVSFTQGVGKTNTGSSPDRFFFQTSAAHSSRAVFQGEVRSLTFFLQKGEFSMQDILKEYGPALITVVAILALIALVTFLIGKDGGSVVGKAFSNLITDFFSKATGAVSSGQSTTTPASPQGIIMLMGGL